MLTELSWLPAHFRQYDGIIVLWSHVYVVYWNCGEHSIKSELLFGSFVRSILVQWHTQEFFSRGVQQIQLRTERTGIWGW